MARSKFLGLCLTAVMLFSVGLEAEQPGLTLKDVRKTMRKLFSYHVENKKFDSVIAKRVLKIYIEKCDPEKIYFLKDEVEPYLSLNEVDVERLIQAYNQDDFALFIRLNDEAVAAITRCQNLRGAVFQSLAQGRAIEPSSSSDYPKTLGELEERLYRRFGRLLAIQEAKMGRPLSSKEKERYLKRIDQKLQRIEAKYLPVSEKGVARSKAEQDALLTLHLLKSMARSLDAHTAYYSADEAKELRTALKKEFEGVGIIFKETDEGIVVADLITGSPAHRSGQITVGDSLVEIEQKATVDLSFDDVLDLLKESKKSSVELVFQRGLNPQQTRLHLKKEKIVLNDQRLTFTVEPYGDGYIAKIVLPGFYDNGEGVNSERDLKEAFQIIKGMGPLYGVVIDMRENSGGFLTQAVKVSGMFINKGIIVISKYADGEIRCMRDTEGRLYYQGPLLLLTSKASASAAEIVAQALQDYGVALVVGDERTYGKGSMQYQTVTDDGADAYFKVTVGRYYTISGRSTQIEGVKADIVVQSEFFPYKIGERYLEYPLPSDNLDMNAVAGKNPSREGSEQFQLSFQKRSTRWTQMLPTLKKNSQIRLAKDPNFQNFMKSMESREGRGRGGWGADDLQLKEAVNILKDMIELSNRS